MKSIGIKINANDLSILQQTLKTDGKLSIPKDINLEDFLAVLLMEAVDYNRTDIVESILNYSHNGNVLLSSDDTGWNPLFRALMHGQNDVISVLDKYISNHKNNFVKVPLEKDEADILLTVISVPAIENMTEKEYFDYINDNYLVYLYDDASLGKLQGQIDDIYS